MYHTANDPAAGDGEVAEIVRAFPASDNQHNSHNVLNFQASRLRERYALSWQAARLTAELVYGWRRS
jgi:ribose 1,5-bisphosphokinase PhnN